MKPLHSFATLLNALLIIPFATAASVEISKRSSWSCCDPWGTTKEGPYTIYQNLFAASAATAGSQCMNLNSYSDNTVAWHTNWTWAGGPTKIKSYGNIDYTLTAGVQLSSISSIPTTWVWEQTWSGSMPTNDVSYDIMIGSSSDVNAARIYEVMIWLAAYGGAGPISSDGSAIATTTIAGHSWSLYSGYNGATKVFSFVSPTPIKSFSGDLMDFLNYLSNNNGLPNSQYLIVLEAGTEPFMGTTVKLETIQYSISVNTAYVTDTQTVYGQCGGQDWTGPIACASGSTCTYSNAWFSQCIPS